MHIICNACICTFYTEIHYFSVFRICLMFFFSLVTEILIGTEKEGYIERCFQSVITRCFPQGVN